MGGVAVPPERLKGSWESDGLDQVFVVDGGTCVRQIKKSKIIKNDKLGCYYTLLFFYSVLFSIIQYYTAL